MANTLIQIKKSTVTATPSAGSLESGELAYSYVSNTAFIGTSDGNGVLEIGGKFHVDRITGAWVTANAAYDAANAAAGGIDIVGVYNQANNAYAQGNIALGQANSAWDKANLAYTFAANNAHRTANAAYAHANAAHILANTTWTYAANDVMHTANSAYDKANAANSLAFSKLDAAGGTITGSLTINQDLSVQGNLRVLGQMTTINTAVSTVNDPLIVLANNNTSGDVVDIGVIGRYQNATSQNVYTGLFRDSTTKEWFVFDRYFDGYLANTNHIDTTANNFSVGFINANLRSSNVILNGINVHQWILATHVHANSAHALANAAYTFAANNAFLVGNTAHIQANAAYALANTTWTYAANTVMLAANTAYAKANTANIAADFANIRSAFANTAAGAAFDKANTANINAADASFLTTGTVPSGRLSGSYTGITGVGTITTGVWNGTNVAVAYGGTGRLTFTQNGILYGNTAGPINVTAAGTEGQVLLVNVSGVPEFSHLDGGSF